MRPVARIHSMNYFDVRPRDVRRTSGVPALPRRGAPRGSACSRRPSFLVPTLAARCSFDRTTSTANHSTFARTLPRSTGRGSLAHGLTGSHLEAPVPSPAPDPRPGHRYSIPLAYLASGPPTSASPSATETPLHRSPPPSPCPLSLSPSPLLILC